MGAQVLCVMEGFRDWLSANKSETFPVKDREEFKLRMLEYVKLTETQSVYPNMVGFVADDDCTGNACVTDPETEKRYNLKFLSMMANSTFTPEQVGTLQLLGLFPFSQGFLLGQGRTNSAICVKHMVHCVLHYMYLNVGSKYARLSFLRRSNA